MIFFSPFRQYKKQLADLYKKKNDLESDEDDTAEPGSDLDAIIEEINQYIEGPYAEAVFSYYKEKNPQLVRIQTGEEFSWQEAFGENFGDVSKSLRHSLVGLVEGGGRYKIK